MLRPPWALHRAASVQHVLPTRADAIERRPWESDAIISRSDCRSSDRILPGSKLGDMTQGSRLASPRLWVALAPGISLVAKVLATSVVGARAVRTLGCALTTDRLQ